MALLRWVGFILLFLVIALAVFLGSAHLQVRAVSPALPDLGDIRRVTDQGGSVTVNVLTTATQSSPLGSLGHVAVVLTWEDGRRFLIDTGMPPEAAVAFGKPMEWLLDAAPTRTFGGAAEQLGEARDSIGGIGFTHLHSDHTDGLVDVCARQSTPAAVYQVALQAAEINHTTQPGDDAIEASVCERRQLDGEGALAVAEFPGLAMVPLGGHTPGSTLFALRSNGHLWLFSGDITNDKRSIDENLPKPLVYSLLVVPEDTARTEQLRNWLAALDAEEDVTVLPAHDVEVMLASGLPPWNGG